jgi:hypothetical protein
MRVRLSAVRSESVAAINYVLQRRHGFFYAADPIPEQREERHGPSLKNCARNFENHCPGSIHLRHAEIDDGNRSVSCDAQRPNLTVPLHLDYAVGVRELKPLRTSKRKIQLKSVSIRRDSHRDAGSDYEQVNFLAGSRAAKQIRRLRVWNCV